MLLYPPKTWDESDVQVELTKPTNGYDADYGDADYGGGGDDDIPF